MPISTVHPSYSARSEDWCDCRNAFEGSRAIKCAGTKYLPKLKGQTQSEYDAYKSRALFYSITAKTLSALQGMALSKAPELKYPDKLKPYFEDKSGTQFYELLSNTIVEILLMGRFGVLIDRPASGGMPYLTPYPTENIVNWDCDDEGNLVMLVLREIYFDWDPNDRYVLVEKTRYRELWIADGKLNIVVHESSANDPKAFTAGAATTITNVGKPIDFIPFFCVNPVGVGMEPGKPPMLDIVDINISHYRTSADLEHGRHFTGLPTPYVIGADVNGKMNIGSVTAWIVPDPNAKVGFLEFTGQGLGSLEKALAEKQSQLASLSARLIDNSTRGSEAAETVKLRYLSETSSLVSIVRAAEAFLNLIYNAIGMMEGLGDNSVNVSLDKDFLATKMSASDLTAWVNAYLSGGVTKEMLVYALKRGDALPPPGSDMGTIPDPPPPAPTQPTQTKPA